MQVIGHRGCAAEFPENTLAAVRGCAPHVDMIEIDVRRCGSGEVVVFHDDRLDRLTDATGAVSECDYRELAALTIGDSTESIPTLADLFETLPASVGLNIELKETELDEDVLALVSECSREIIVSSFEPAAIEPFRDRSIPTALISADSIETAIDTASELGCEYVHPQYTTIDSAAVEQAHDQCLSINAWTVPTESAVRRLRADGVDGVIVDTWRVVSEC